MLARALLLLLFLSGCYDADPVPIHGESGAYDDGHAWRCHGPDRGDLCERRRGWCVDGDVIERIPEGEE